MIKLTKQGGPDFSRESLYDEYCTKILWDVYVRRSVFNRGSYGFVEKLLEQFVM